jgi:hypothetical protein
MNGRGKGERVYACCDCLRPSVTTAVSCPNPTFPLQVWNEVRDFGLYYTFQAHDMAKRDRNHPSIIVNSLWCVPAAPGGAAGAL